MGDDLNTADALSVIFDYVRDLNTFITGAPCAAALDEALKALQDMADVMGLLYKQADTTPAEVKQLVEARAAAKKAKNWPEADRIRGELASQWPWEDTPQGPKLKKL